MSFSQPQTSISVVRGDLFEQQAHLVIGACDTFDTQAPFIAPSSVQGQFAIRVYGGDFAQLDTDIETALRLTPVVDTIAKPGKTDRYGVGSVVTLRSRARRFFLTAYTTMDARNKAHGTVDGLWKSLWNLWDEVRAESNGSPVAIAVVGGGQSGLSPVLPAQDAIRFIALSFMFASRNEKVCDELRIVACPTQYDQLDHLELQAFLTSLRRS